MDEKIYKEEQQHLTDVYRQLTKMQKELTDAILQLDKDASEEKNDIRDNLRFDTADDEVKTEMYAEMETWNRYIDTYNVREKVLEEKLKKVKLLLEAPYFARVTLQFDPEEEEENYYIGRAQISEKNGVNQTVIDWRSPIAETYYNQDNGRTHYEVDGRRIDVDLKLRRQFELERDLLKGYFDTSVAIEDPMLLRSLSRQRTDRMQAITVTIQKEQNAVIRFPDIPVLLVSGIAGSGKTSVLLQRIAYLFYHQRKTLRPENVFLLTLNPIFAQYISGVLPDLGEQNANTLTWTEFLSAAHVPVGGAGTDTQGETLRQIDALLPSYKVTEEDIRPVTQKNEKVLGRGRILEIIRSFDGRIPTGDRLFQVVSEELKEEAKRALLKKKLRQDEREEKEEEGETSPADENALENDFGGAFRQIREIGFLDIGHIGTKLLHKNSLTSIEWLYLKMALTGLQNRNAQYVMIDEVQDYTEAQIMTLQRYFPRAKFMMLGDEFQSIREGNVSFDKILKIFAEQKKQAQELFLTTSYRSSPEITELFAGLLPREKKLEAKSCQRPGEEPVIRAFSSEKDYLDALTSFIHEEEGEGLTAVICENKKSLKKVASLLGDDAPKVVSGEDALPKKGVFLMELRFAKGLEFDSVILPDADEATYKDTELDRHKLYTAISRATTRIRILSKGNLSPLLKQT